METYPVDIPAEQIVRWLMQEDRTHSFELLLNATRSFQPGELTGGGAARLGDEEREEVSEITEVGLLEISSKHKPNLWTLRVRVADDIGPRLPEDEPVPEGEEEIDLPTFYEEFIKTSRGFAEVSLDAESPAGKAQATRVLDAILTDWHKGGKGMAPPGKRPGKKH